MDLSETRLMVAAPIFASLLDRGRMSPYRDEAERDLRIEQAAKMAINYADVLLQMERITR